MQARKSYKGMKYLRTIGLFIALLSIHNVHSRPHERRTPYELLKKDMRPIKGTLSHADNERLTIGNIINEAGKTIGSADTHKKSLKEKDPKEQKVVPRGMQFLESIGVNHYSVFMNLRF